MVMTTAPRYYYLRESGKPEYVEHLKAELDQLPKGKAYKEIWEEYMTNGRCKFYEHGEGQCKTVTVREKPFRSVL